jgi:dihydroorotase
VTIAAGSRRVRIARPGGAEGEVELGRPVDVEIRSAWLVDPVANRTGAAHIVIRDGNLETVRWLDGAEAEGIDDRGVIVAPGFTDLHAHFREPGNAAAETIATGLAAAAHGGFTTVCLMPNTTPAMDQPWMLAGLREKAASSGSPVRALAYGAATTGRASETLAPIGALADAGVVGFSDDGSPIHSATLLRNALAYAGMFGLPIIDHPEEATLTDGAEANEGLISTVLGLRGWPAAAEAIAVERDIAILADVVREVPGARLHLTHLSTAGSLELVRRAKADGLPVTCDVTPHHLALTDEWLAGARRFAWEAIDHDGRARDPWSDGAIEATPYDTSVRVNPPLRTALDARACIAALLDGTADAIATDHAPHTEVDKDVEFGLAANGISGIETALGLVLEAVDAGQLPLATAVAALTTDPKRVLGDRASATSRGFVEGEPADLVVFDRSDRWTVTPDGLASKGKNSPLLGRALSGRVLLTLAQGCLAYDGSEP